MKRPALLLLLLCAFLLLPRGAASFAADSKAPTLLGIAKLVVGTASVEVTLDDSLQGLGLYPALGEDSTANVKSLTAKLGESFTVSDRQHLTFVYKLLRINAGSATLHETQFALLPGYPEHRNDHTRHVRAYDHTAEPKR